MEKLTKLPEDVLEALSTNYPAGDKPQNSKPEPSEPAAAAVDSESKDDRLTDDESKLLMKYDTSVHLTHLVCCKTDH